MCRNKKTLLITTTLLICLAGIIFIWQYIPNTRSITPCITNNLRGYNLIIINIDALRSDHLSCYGYHRKTSPFIDSLAQQGMVFEQAMSNSSFTRESVSVLFTGRLPSSGNSVGWNAKPSVKIKTMGDRFKKAGYGTGFFSNSNALKIPAFTRGFEEIWFCESQGLNRNGPKLSKRAGEFIGECNKKRQKFMIYLHFLDPHGPYRPPKKFYLRFAQELYHKPLHIYNNVRINCEKLIKEGFGPGEERFEDMALRYDAEIAHVDHSIRLLFEILKSHHLLHKTLVIITADHGEEFLDHNYVGHGWTLYNESLHIPLLFWAPGIIQTNRFKALVSTVDILPTILELMEISHQTDKFDGTALFKRRKQGFYFTPPSKPYIAELLLNNRNLIRAVIKDDWKYIGAIRWLEPSERPKAIINLNKSSASKKNKKLAVDIWGPVTWEGLFDLSIDPEEKYNLPDMEKRKKFKKIIDEYKKYCQMKGLKIDPGKNKQQPLSKKDREKLKSLGYL